MTHYYDAASSSSPSRPRCWLPSDHFGLRFTVQMCLHPHGGIAKITFADDTAVKPGSDQGVTVGTRAARDQFAVLEADEFHLTRASPAPKDEWLRVIRRPQGTGRHVFQTASRTFAPDSTARLRRGLQPVLHALNVKLPKAPPVRVDAFTAYKAWRPGFGVASVLATPLRFA